jgi:hypothetical protein
MIPGGSIPFHIVAGQLVPVGRIHAVIPIAP